MNMKVNLLNVLTEGRDLPEGCDTWGVRAVRPDGASRHGFVWPLTPGWVEAPGPIIERNYDECPSMPGDGICVARTWVGMASARVPARTLLLCAVNSDDVLGDGYDKLRARRVYVVSVIDGERLLREHGRGANLRDADLRGADLSGANLRDADLRGAELSNAELCSAYLRGADLCSANLYSADLSGANLRDADLRSADLHCADLRRADLRGADLAGANLHSADLAGAYLDGANLRSADLHCTDLRRAELSGANLICADLRNAYLGGAYLRDADLTGADLGGWERDPATGFARRKA